MFSLIFSKVLFPLHTLTKIIKTPQNINGSNSNDKLVGDASANIIKGLAGNDTIDGGAGNDSIYGGLGNDSLIGGTGKDTYYFENNLGASQIDTIVDSSADANTLDLSVITTATNVDLFTGIATIFRYPLDSDIIYFANGAISNVIGGSNQDFIIGNSLNNYLAGGAGDDTYGILWGNFGNDIIFDNLGNNTLNLSGFTKDIDAILKPQGNDLLINVNKIVNGTSVANGSVVIQDYYNSNFQILFSDGQIVSPSSNTPPTAYNDIVSLNANDFITFNPLENDTDQNGDTLSVINFTNPSNGSLTQNADGTLTYTPNADFIGADSFNYTISDGSGGTSTATVDLTVNSSNNNPVAIDDTLSVSKNGSLSFFPGELEEQLLANDTDPDGNTLSVVDIGQPSNGTLIQDSETGSYTYTPNPDFVGTDNLTYTIYDENGGISTATVYINVNNNLNIAPVATNDEVVLNEDNSININVLANDVDGNGDTLSISDFTNPSNGNLSQNADGSFTYKPNLNFNGNDSFTYTINDGNGGTSTATVNLTISPVNDAPIAGGDQTAILNEGTSYVLSNNDLKATDIDSSQLTYTASNITNGSLQEYNGSNWVDSDNSFTQAQIDAGQVRYVHNGSETTSASFNFSVSDGALATSSNIMNFSVNPVNDAPIAGGDKTATLNEGRTYTLSNKDLKATDIDNVDANLVYSVTSINNGTLQEWNGTSWEASDNTFTQAQINSRSVRFVHNGSETTNASFGFTVSDGQITTAPQVMNFNINPVNDAAIISPVYQVANEDTILSFKSTDFTNQFSDAENNSLTQIRINSLPSNGILKLSGTAVIANQIISAADLDNLTFEPKANYNGSVSFRWQAYDGAAWSNRSTINLTINPVNDAPIAGGDKTQDQT